MQDSMGFSLCTANSGKGYQKKLDCLFSKNEYIILYAQSYREAVSFNID